MLSLCETAATARSAELEHSPAVIHDNEHEHAPQYSAGIETFDNAHGI